MTDLSVNMFARDFADSLKFFHARIRGDSRGGNHGSVILKPPKSSNSFCALIYSSVMSSHAERRPYPPDQTLRCVMQMK
jgi:hypothetical protein